MTPAGAALEAGAPDPAAAGAAPGADRWYRLDPRERERRENLGLPALAGLVAFLFAMALLPGTPGLGDGAEFTLALALAGAPHPTGYPLYVLLGHPFALLLHGIGLPWAAAANAWSALAAAVAIALVVRLSLELARAAAGPVDPAADHDFTGAGARARDFAIRLAAIAPATLLALDSVWLMYATQAEVYAAWYALTAAAALFAFRQVRRMAAPRAPRLVGAPSSWWRDADVRAAGGWGLLVGASLAHHLMAVMILFPLSLLLAHVAWRSGRWRGSLALAALAGAALPLASYAFIAWRAFHPARSQWPIDPAWIGVWRHVSGSLYTRYLGGFAPRGIQAGLIRGGILPFLAGLPLLGVWALREESVPLRRWLIAVLVGAVLLTGFVFRYGVTDPAAYFVPAVMFACLIATPAIVILARRSLPAAVATLAVAVLAVAAISIPQTLERRREIETLDAQVRSGWKSIPFDRGIVIWLDDAAARLEILGTLEHQRPGLYVVNPNLLTWPANRIRFARRFGFDPMDGVGANYWADLPGHLHRRTGLPVIDFRDVLAARPEVSAPR